MAFSVGQLTIFLLVVCLIWACDGGKEKEPQRSNIQVVRSGGREGQSVLLQKQGQYTTGGKVSTRRPPLLFDELESNSTFGTPDLYIHGVNKYGLPDADANFTLEDNNGTLRSDYFHEYLRKPVKLDRPSQRANRSRSGRPQRSYRLRYDDWDDVQEFTTGRQPFNKRLITWSISKYASYLNEYSVDNEVRRAFATWSAVAQIDFQKSSYGADIDIQFPNGEYDHNCAHPFRSNVIAHSFGRAPVKIHFNGDERLSIGSDHGTDLFTVTLHEIGHALGIGHSQYNHALMAASYTGKFTSLTNDDIQAIRALYGSRSSGGGGGGGSSSSRLCTPGAWYCGRELSAMGYTNTYADGLYECDNDKDGLYHMTCDTCNGGSNIQSYCACQVGNTYCGYLLRWTNFVFTGLNDHSLYRCTEPHRVSDPTVCSSTCSPSSQSSCDLQVGVTTCTPGRKFCGLELAARTHTGWKGNMLYECDNSGNRGINGKTCISGCKIDSPDSYCLSGNMARPG